MPRPSPNDIRAALEAKILEYGWVIQAVFADEATDAPSFAYTTGLHDHGLPELLAFGLPTQVSHQLLNDLACDQMLRKATAQPLTGPRQHPNWPMAMHLLPADPHRCEDYATFAWSRSQARASFVQVVWPDPQAVLPWEHGFDTAFNRYQPILGPTPPSE